METPICQIAISVRDLERSRAWYTALGLDASGGLGPISGSAPAQMLGLPRVDLHIAWLAGADPMSQIELMHFRDPPPRARPLDWSPRYAGYGIASLVVAQFDALLERLSETEVPYHLVGSLPRRSVWLRDPDGTWIELMEHDPLLPYDSRQRSGARIRCVTLTVADLEKARRFWISAVGLTAAKVPVCAFNPFPAALALDMDHWSEMVLKGGTVLLRLLAPRQPALLKRIPEYQLNDIGVVNVAAILADAVSFDALCERYDQLGYSFTSTAAMRVGEAAAAIYGHDDQGTSIELGFVLPGHEIQYGWRR